MKSIKQMLGEKIAERISHNSVIGIGTGSTVDAAIIAIGDRIKREKLHVSAITTSIVSSLNSFKEGIVVLDPTYPHEMAFGFDGADAVDSRRRAIKGKGGAMLREKLLAARCKEYVLIVDESKVVEDLAKKCPVPIEVIPEALSTVKRALSNFKIKDIVVRTGSALFGPTVSESGNVILDVTFVEIYDTLDRDLKALPGVVETGLFLNFATEVLVADENGVRSL